MSKPTWYYAKNRQKAGPVSLDSLKKKLSLGELGSDDLVWTVGWESWKKVCDVPELNVPEPPPLPPEEPPPLPAEEPPITAEKEPTGPQKCPGCGYECGPGAIRCGHCGGLLRRSIDDSTRQETGQSEVKNPPLPFAVSIHGERPENYVLLTTDKQWLELLTKCHASLIPGREVDRGNRINNIRNYLLVEASYGLVVEPAEEGADRLKRFFGGRRVLDFRAELKPRSGLKPAATSSEVVKATAAQTGSKVSTTKGISILLILVGLLLPVVSLGFVEGYNPVLGFVGSIPRMEIIYGHGIPNRTSSLRDLITPVPKTIPYGYFFALGCILVCLGTAGVLFNQHSDIPKEQAKNSLPEPPVE